MSAAKIKVRTTTNVVPGVYGIVEYSYNDAIQLIEEYPTVSQLEEAIEVLKQFVEILKGNIQS